MVKELIKKIIDVDVATADLEELIKYPEKYTHNKEDEEKLTALMQLLKLQGQVQE